MRDVQRFYGDGKTNVYQYVDTARMSDCDIFITIGRGGFDLSPQSVSNQDYRNDRVSVAFPAILLDVIINFTETAKAYEKLLECIKIIFARCFEK